MDKTFPAKRFAHDLIYVLSNEPRFWFNALTNPHFTEYLTQWRWIRLWPINRNACMICQFGLCWIVLSSISSSPNVSVNRILDIFFLYILIDIALSYDEWNINWISFNEHVRPIAVQRSVFRFSEFSVFHNVLYTVVFFTWRLSFITINVISLKYILERPTGDHYSNMFNLRKCLLIALFYTSFIF